MTNDELVKTVDEIGKRLYALNIDLNEMEKNLDVCCEMIAEVHANIGEPRWTEKDVADAKAFMQLIPDAVYVRRYGSELEFLDRDESVIDDAIIITNALPQLKHAQSAKLEDIIGDAGYLIIGGAE